MTAYTCPVDVFLILTSGPRVLLALRRGTGYADEQWNFPSGKLEAGEPVDAAVCREAHEEVGLTIDPITLPEPHVLHYSSRPGHGRLGLFFALEHDPARHGHPVNAEPHKCGGIDWFDAATLPDDTVPYTVEGWRLWRSGRGFTTAGW